MNGWIANAPIYPHTHPMSAWAGMPAVVGAIPGESPSLGAGVDAMIDISNTGLKKSITSAAGRATLWAAGQAVGQFAQGNVNTAAGIAAASVLAATSYYTAKMLAEQTTQIATAEISKIVSGVYDLIPLYGSVLETIITYGGSATGQTQGERTKECQQGFHQVTWGTAPDGKLMPADIFMAVAVTDAEDAAGLSRDPAFIEQYDGLRPDKLHGGVVGRNLASFSRLLRLLEEEPAPSADADAAWPKAGLTTPERKALKKLRLGMSAAYKDPLTKRQFTSQVTDGGSALWPLYADILWTAWKQGRLPYGYLLWRASDEDKYYAQASALWAKGLGPTLLKGVPAGQVAVNRHFEDYDDGRSIPCPLLDNRALVQFDKMIKGWNALVANLYEQFKGQGQAADNPMHEPPGIPLDAAQRAFGFWTGALLLAGAAAAGLYFFRPALARSLVAQGAALGKQGVAQGTALAKSGIASGQRLIERVT